MKLRPALIALAILATVAAAIWIALPDSPPPPTTPRAALPAPPESDPAPPQETRNPKPETHPVPSSPSAKPLARTRASPLAAELNAPGFDAQHDVATLHAMLRQYQHLLRGRPGHPIGNDGDLARVLTGHNPMKLTLLPPNHPALTPTGRLCDRWGTPYFIHPRGRGAFEIRSAGPDHQLFTPDDLIQNPGTRTTDLPDLPDTPEPPDE